MATKFFGTTEFMTTTTDSTNIIPEGYEYHNLRFVSHDDCDIIVNGTTIYWGAGMVFNARDFNASINSFIIKGKGITYHYVGSLNQ